jgi:lipoate---protein ligase
MIIHLIHLKNVPIFKQLQLEETLLREDNRNFCILNEGSSPAIVMGISGKPEELIDMSQANDLKIPIIKRFSGGGTVVIDSDTLFVTFLCNKEEFTFPSYPERIMKWSEEFYKKALTIEEFALKEHDFVIGNFKCGGNAQYIKKDRWLQHTSFLWNYCPFKMKSLLFPRKVPDYRNGRDHENFLCKLNEFLSSKDDFFKQIKFALSKQFEVIELDLADMKFGTTTRKQTRILEHC